MSIIDKVRKKAEQLNRKARQVAEKAKHETERKVREAARAAQKAADEAAKLAKESENKLEHELMDVLKDIKRLAKDAEHQASEAKRILEAVPDKVNYELTKQLPRIIEQAASKVEIAVTEKLPDLLTKQAPKMAASIADTALDNASEFAAEFAQAITKPALRMAKTLISASAKGLRDAAGDEPELVADLNAVGGYIRLGMIRAEFRGGVQRLTVLAAVLDKYASSPPKFRRSDVRLFLRALGPDSLKFIGSVKGNIVVVGTSLFEGEAGVNAIPFRLGIRAVDEVLRAAGVPE